MASGQIASSTGNIVPAAGSSASGTRSGLGSGGDANSSSANVATAMGSDIASAQYGLDGAGLKIGILSSSFDALGGAAADESDGALPPASRIHILQDSSSGNDEGRAMAEIVHSVAPDAQIYFYSAQDGAGSFAAGIAAMQAAGCQVICDDVTSLKEPFFQMGDSFEQAIDSFAASGGAYFTCASNTGPNAAYEARWQGVQTVLPGIGNVKVMNFGTAAAPVTTETLNLTAKAATSIDLQWAQPWQSIDGQGSSYSLALAIYDPNGKLVDKLDTNDVGGDPIQATTFTPAMSGAYTVAVYQNGGTDPGGELKIIANNNSSPSASFADASGGGSIFGHNLDPNAITVGAVHDINAPAYKSDLESEPFSASGPGQLLFDSSGNPLAAPVSLNGVDISGPDGQPTTLSAQDLNPFFGTSAATPAVAAVGGLMKEANPSLDAAEIKAYLQDTAAPFGAKAQAGAGFVQAPGAVTLAEASNTSIRNDFFGTGQSAILWQGGNRAASIWQVADGSIVSKTDLAVTPGADYTIKGTGDFSNAGGHSDILWQNTAGQVAISHMDGAQTVSQTILPQNPGQGWTVVEAGDFNGDGKSDILFQNAAGALKLWTMNGAAVTSSTLLGDSPGAGWAAEGVGDFQGNGTSDILFQNTNGALSIWSMSGGSIASQSRLQLNPGAGWEVAGTGDFNGTGKAEILLQNSDGALAVWSVNGAGGIAQTAVNFTPGSSWHVAGVGKFGDNGRDDILLQNSTTGAAEICNVSGNQVTSTQIVGSPGQHWQAIVR